MPLFRHDGRLIYFSHIPKTGGSSVENALKDAGAKRAMLQSKARTVELGYGKCSPQHIHAEVALGFFPKGFFDYTFCTIRNPYDRIASEYKMKAAGAKDDPGPDIWITAALNQLRKFAYSRDNHIRPQRAFIMRDMAVFRLEDGLDKPISAALGALGLAADVDIPRHRESAKGPLTVTRDTLNLIQSTYAKDFAQLDYALDSYDTAFTLSD